jgi:hypothetical protein
MMLMVSAAWAKTIPANFPVLHGKIGEPLFPRLAQIVPNPGRTHKLSHKLRDKLSHKLGDKLSHKLRDKLSHKLGDKLSHKLGDKLSDKPGDISPQRRGYLSE